MSMTPEKRVKNSVVKILKEYGAYYFYAATGGYGKSGVPDIICCHNGNFLAIECKAGKNKTTALQDINIAAIREAGGTALVINEENIDDVATLLQVL
jgi:Holliday junction resolvase